MALDGHIKSRTATQLINGLVDAKMHSAWGEDYIRRDREIETKADKRQRARARRYLASPQVREDLEDIVSGLEAQWGAK